MATFLGSISFSCQLCPLPNSQNFFGDQIFFSSKLSYPLKLSKFIGILPFFSINFFFMPKLRPLPNCQISWDPNAFHANYVLVKIVNFLRLKTFFKSINCVPFKIIKFLGSMFFFFFIFHFGSCALLQCFFLVGIKNTSLPINSLALTWH
jgi:hypothetical protein